MRPPLELTSVPVWAAVETCPAADLTGRFWTIIAFGAAAERTARQWCDEIAATAAEFEMRLHHFPDGSADDAACDALSADLAEARVGWRLMMAGPAVRCLRLRAAAVAAGVADDEMTVASTDVTQRAVHCVHCRTVTVAAVELEDVAACTGCQRNLLVHYHVSRRQGTHLGYMADAEQVVS